MADEEDAPPPMEGLHPALSAFRDAFPPGAGQDWAADATTQIQDFLTQKNIADTARATADGTINDIDGFKSQLVGMAHNDPSMMPLALDLVPGAIGAIIGGSDLEDKGDHAVALTAHIQSEIARAGVQSLAIRDDAAARQALDAYGHHFTDEDKSTLGGFISTMASARAADHAAQTVEVARNARLASDTRGHGWLSQLSDPRTGDVALPNDWVRNMMADPGVQPDTKAALWQAHDRLQGGDAVASDPHLVSALLDRLAGSSARPSPAEVLSHAGDGLTLADAQHLSAAAFPRDPAVRANIGRLADSVAQARQTLAAPENGPAGQRAFERFVNWAMPAARQGAVFDPAHKDYALANNHIQRFAPVMADNVPPPAGERKPLSEIFGGKR